MSVELSVASDIFTDKNLEQRERYKCPKCGYLLKDAVQVSCGHWMCQECAKDIFENSDARYICPKVACEENLTIEDGKPFFPDRFVRKEINNMRVKCFHKTLGCQWTGSLLELEKHSSMCRKSVTQCPHCRNMISNVGIHIKLCPKALVSCPLKSLGCNKEEKMTREECIVHCSSSLMNHLMLMVEAVLELKSHQTPYYEERGSSVVRTTDNPDSPEMQSRNVHPFPSDSSTIEERTMKPRTSSLTQEQHSGEVSSAKASTTLLSPMIHRPLDTAHNPPLPQHASDMGEYTMRPLEAAVYTDYVYELLGGTGISGLLKSLHYDGVVTEAFRIIEKRFLKTEAQVSLLTCLSESEDEIKQLKDKISEMEASTYNGTFIWKIPEINNRSNKSLYSPPFYTSRQGYKMCMRAYFNGDGTTHLSLYFVLMKSDYDAVLVWPFDHPVTCMLYRGPSATCNYQTFKPSPSCASFQKPECERNEPYFINGFQSIAVPHAYIVEDSMYIKIIVDCTK